MRCDTHHSLRVLETVHPPTFDLPAEGMDLAMPKPTWGRSFCWWKGVARDFDVVDPADQTRRLDHQ